MMKKFLLITCMSAVVLNIQAQKKDKHKDKETTSAVSANGTLVTHQDSVSYALGVSMAETLKKSGITDFDRTKFVEAINAQLNGTATMTAQDADKLYRAEQKKLADAKNEANKKIGEEYLEKNKTKAGVMTTATGLQYKTTQEGTGISPGPTDKVTVHYHGLLIDGTVFDSSVDRGQPATFGLNQVIPGWTEGLQLMKEGGKTTFYIPQALAYGGRGQGKIAAFSTLIFDVELLKVEKADSPKPPTTSPINKEIITDGTGTANGKPTSEKEAPVMMCEQMPVYPGGDAAMMEFISKNIKYPPIAKESGKEGTVFLSFVVEKDGSVSDVKTTKGCAGAPELDAEAIRVAKLLKGFAPGKQGGKPVRVQMQLPVKFKA